MTDENSDPKKLDTEVLFQFYVCILSIQPLIWHFNFERYQLACTAHLSFTTCKVSYSHTSRFYLSLNKLQETRQEMSYPNVISLYFANFLRLMPQTEEFPWDDLRKILQGQKKAKVQNGE